MLDSKADMDILVHSGDHLLTEALNSGNTRILEIMLSQPGFNLEMIKSAKDDFEAQEYHQFEPVCHEMLEWKKLIDNVDYEFGMFKGSPRPSQFTESR